MSSSCITPSSQLKQALVWVSEETLCNPDKPRHLILQEAQLRFDLTPAESEFLDNNFQGN
ncbi:MAG: hypothetical protein ACOX5Z_01840 [Desulfobulbus sp.]|jgi:hypothetical protein